MSWFIGRSSGATLASASSSSSRIGASSSPALAHATRVCPYAGASAASPRSAIASSSQVAPRQSDTCDAACTIARHSPRPQRMPSPLRLALTSSHDPERTAAHTDRRALLRATCSVLTAPPRPCPAARPARSITGRAPRPPRPPRPLLSRGPDRTGVSSGALAAEAATVTRAMASRTLLSA
eukprot:scaffold24270_cov112-Isochrysis_galbana.AAC.8